MAAVERLVSLDDWAKKIYETSGNIRWHSIFGFSSVELVKAGYVKKDKGVWMVTDDGRAAVKEPSTRGHICRKLIANRCLESIQSAVI